MYCKSNVSKVSKKVNRRSLLSGDANNLDSLQKKTLISRSPKQIDCWKLSSRLSSSTNWDIFFLIGLIKTPSLVPDCWFGVELCYYSLLLSDKVKLFQWWIKADEAQQEVGSLANCWALPRLLLLINSPRVDQTQDIDESIINHIKLRIL